MDPAVLNYLQSQQMNNSQMQPQGQPQGMPQPQPGMGQSMPNPFNVGISNAIESARQSLGMTQKQQDKALRSSMLTFANNMSQQPRERGFFNNFAAVGKALSPAIANHDQEEEAALVQNNQLANQILAYQNQEQARQAQGEERDWRRQLAERQLAGTEEDRAWNRQYHGAQLEETKRHHNLLDNFRQDDRQNKSEGKSWEIKAKQNTTKVVPDLTEKYERNQEILPRIDELSEILGSSKLAGSSKAAAFKRYIAKATGTDEDILRAKNAGQFYLEWLKQNTSGVLSDKDITVYSAGFADIEKNPVAGIEALNKLKDKIEKHQGTIKQRLELYESDPGANLSKLELLNRNNIQSQDVGQQEAVGQQAVPQQEEYILIRGPSGQEQEVYYEDAAALLQKPGYQRVGQ